jgi:uncharacterized membrane protein
MNTNVRRSSIALPIAPCNCPPNAVIMGGMRDGPNMQFGLRSLFWAILLACLAATFMSPNAAVTAGFVSTFFVLLALKQLIMRV